MSAVISMKGISKSFGPVKALNSVDLELQSGEVLALLGDNGAGKSTIIKILAGLYASDAGSMEINGVPVDWRGYGVKRARELGVETVYQERSLAEKQPLWRNVFVGRHVTNCLGLIRADYEKEETRKLLRDVMGLRGVGIHPEASVRTLSGGERQGLAIARAMYFNASIIVLDEPTTALAVNEAEKVLAFIRSIREKGKSCIFISHELQHVYSVADRFVIVEHGRSERVLRREGLSFDELVRCVMSGAGDR